MGQQHSRLSFSVGTQLLFHILALIVVIIGALSISAIAIIGRDRRDDSAQDRLTEASLAGTEFTNTVRHAMDVLRDSLRDPRRTTQILEGHSGAVHLATGTFDVRLGQLRTQRQVSDQALLQELGLDGHSLQIPNDWLKAVVPELLHNGYAFLNLSRPDGVPLIGIFLTNPAPGKPAGSFPVAYAITPIRKFGPELSRLNLTIATRSGWVLFDTDPVRLFSRAHIGTDPLFQAAIAGGNSGTRDYEAEHIRYLGGFAAPGFGLVVMTRAEWQEAMLPAYQLTEKIILLGIMAGSLSVLLALYFSKTITAPIGRLYGATAQVGRGDFDLDLHQDVDRRDELGELARSFKAMAARIRELFGERAKKVVLEGELDIASTVQQNLIPPPVFRNERIQIHSHYQSASQCGGDWWGFFEVGDRLIFGIADTTGHGLPSALMTASARSCFSMFEKLAEEDPAFNFSAARMLAYANRVVFDANHGQVNMTFFLGVIDFNQMMLTFANAGHNPPWILRESPRGQEIISLVSAGPRLGENRDTAEYEEKSLALRPDDLLFLYTDGVLEGRDRAGVSYGKKRMRALLQAESLQSTDRVVDNLVADFFRHVDGMELEDDITIAAARILRGTA